MSLCVAAASQLKEPKRFNADYLDGLVEYLGTCSMDQAIAEYNRLISAPEGDDWLTAQLGRFDLFYLLARILRRPDVQHPWLYARCREIEASPYGNLDLWAREHYKSTILTFGLTIQDILVDPDVTCGIFSHTRPGAKAFLRQIKTEFEVNEDLKALYPDVLWRDPKKDAPKWSEDEGIVVRRSANPKEATVEAWGLVDGQPTGKHFRKLIYDDVVVRESVTTPDMIQKTTAALELSYNLGAEGGDRRFIGTRYHYNDTYRTIIERGTAKVRLYDGTEKNSGDITKPMFWTVDRMAQKRRDMGPHTFGTQILQNPKGDETQGFRREWLRYYKDAQGGRGMNKYILVDPAHSKKQGSDFTAMWVIGLGPDENYYALDMVRDRLSLSQRCQRLMEWHRKWKPLDVRYERYGLQSDIEHIKAVQEASNYRFEITEVAGPVAKPERIKRLIPMFEKGKVWLPVSHHMTNSEGEVRNLVHDFIEDEYCAFPVGLHDDMLDGLARIAEPELKLQWPIKRGTNIKTEPWRESVPGMGM